MPMNKTLKLKSINWKSFQKSSNVLSWNHVFKQLLMLSVFVATLSVFFGVKSFDNSENFSLTNFITDSLKLPQLAYALTLVAIMALSLFSMIKFSFNKTWWLIIPFISYGIYMALIIKSLVYSSAYKFQWINLIGDPHIFIILGINGFLYAINAILERRTNPFWVGIQIRRIALTLLSILFLLIAKHFLIEILVLKKPFIFTQVKTFWLLFTAFITFISLLFLKIYNMFIIHRTNQEYWLKNFKMSGILLSFFGAFLIFMLAKVFVWSGELGNVIYASVAIPISIISSLIILFGKSEFKESHSQVLVLELTSTILLFIWFGMSIKGRHVPINQSESLMIAAIGIFILELSTYIKSAKLNGFQKAIHSSKLSLAIITIIAYVLIDKTGAAELFERFNIQDIIKTSLLITYSAAIMLPIIKQIFKVTILAFWLTKNRKTKELNNA